MGLIIKIRKQTANRAVTASNAYAHITLITQIYRQAHLWFLGLGQASQNTQALSFQRLQDCTGKRETRQACAKQRGACMKARTGKMSQSWEYAHNCQKEVTDTTDGLGSYC